MQIGGLGGPQVRRGAGWGYGLSGSQWERVSLILRAGDPPVWLRAVRAAERGRDGRVKIAGKSAPKLGAVPRLRLPSASPLKTRFYMSPLSPTVPSSPGLPPLPSLVAFYQVAKATRTAPASSRLHSPPLLSRSRYRSPSSTPHTEFTAKIFSHPFLILKTPHARTFLTPTLLFPAPYSPPVLAFLPNPGRPLCAPSLPDLPRFPKPGAPRQLSLRYKRSLGIAQLSPPPPSPSLDPSLDNLSSFVWRILTERHCCFSWQHSPLQITYPLSSLFFFHFQMLFLTLLKENSSRLEKSSLGYEP